MKVDIGKKVQAAWELFDKGNTDEARKLYLDCLNEASEDARNMRFSVLMGLVYVESFSGNYDSARGYACDLCAAAGDSIETHIGIHQSGMVERMAGRYDEALEIFHRENVFLLAELPDNKAGLSANLYETAYIKLRTGMYVQAETVMRQALEAAEQAADAMCIGCAARGMGEIFAASGRETEARLWFERAITAFAEAGDDIAIDEVRAMM